MNPDLAALKEEYHALVDELSNPALISDWPRFQELSRRKAFIEKLLKKEEELKELKNKIAENEEIITAREDAELVTLAEQELLSVKTRTQTIQKELESLQKNEDVPSALIMEIRPGTGCGRGFRRGGPAQVGQRRCAGDGV